VAFLEYTGALLPAHPGPGAKYTVMQAAMVSAERIFGLPDTPLHPSRCARRRGAHAERRGAPPPRPWSSNVWFAYEGEQWVLRDCSFTLAPGERVALVGPTGEGKTTIARLMIRAYDVTRGVWWRGGRAGVGAPSLPPHVGLVPQEAFLFSGTVEDNLRLAGNGGADRPAIERALAAANAERFVAALPRGLGEELRERGLNLSQGQRQLLAIARAIIYNPRVLALDEATSSIDPESEAQVRIGLARLLEGRTSVVIAHRLSTIQRADRIFVLHRGQIREAGGHGLLARVALLAAVRAAVRSGPA
jgi:ATP-binding cassette subfamily B protein